MFLARRPSKRTVARWLAREIAAPLPPAMGSSGYTVDHHRVLLGTGEACYARARDALRRWAQFDLGWVEVVPADAPVRIGTTVAVLAHHLGFWSLNPSRIVTVVDDPERFGFTYRTLTDHALDGDERFLVERDADGAVSYEVRARSRPRHVLSWLGYPFARRIQRRFARDSIRALAAAVRG